MSSKTKNPQPYMSEAWYAGLMREVSLSSKAAVGEKMGIKRSVISQVCNGCGPYGDGRSSVKRIEQAYRRTYEQITCHHTRQVVNVEHCREMALCKAPTHNPLRMIHWQECQSCEFKPSAEVKSLTKSAASEERTVQQAGIIDKVTLPLPEVGAPQVMEVV